MIDYKSAGVSIEEGSAFVEYIKNKTAGFGESIGSYGALFPLNLTSIRTPVLVSATDGVGTKVKLAQMLDEHINIGIDLVAMCVNDLICRGAKPLFFLDYIACGKINKPVMQKIIDSIIEGCKESDMRLIGGETAEMPGVYEDNVYDLAGFAVGIVDQSKILPRKAEMEAGDIIVGLPSNGFHSNGFSLIRKIADSVKDNEWQPEYKDKFDFYTQALQPTKIYVSTILAIQEFIKGAAHITGGGITENFPRILPDNLKAVVKTGAWSIQPEFSWLQKMGSISEKEMLRVFNMGLGMLLIVAPANFESLQQKLEEIEEKYYVVGNLEVNTKYDKATVEYIKDKAFVA